MCRGASWEQDFSSSLYIVTIILFMGGNPMYYVEVRSGPKTKQSQIVESEEGVRVVEADVPSTGSRGRERSWIVTTC